MTRRERLERKAERRREWAESRAAKSSESFERARSIADGIPMGQPILVGHHSERAHRRDIGRIESGMTAGLEHGRKAEEHEEKAAGIESQLARSIYSDDVDAVERLAERIAELEAERARIKAYNASCRKGKRDVSLLDEKQQADLVSTARACPYQIGDNGSAPAYWLTNLGGNIRRNRERLEQIKRTGEMVAAGDRGRSRSMLARFSSSCADCGGEIEKGSPIVYYRVTREAVHAECPDKASPQESPLPYVVKCDECKQEIRRCETVTESARGGYCDACRAEIDRRYPDRLSPERCAECGEPVTVGELERVRSDIDFVEHGARGHLVRIAKES